jgi:hypothetical protein
MTLRTSLHWLFACTLVLFCGCIRHPLKAPVPVTHGIVSFQAQPRTVPLGNRATLRWQTVGMAEVFIDQDPPPRNIFSQETSSLIENLPPRGELIVQPQVTTTYILGCMGNNWSSYASARVKVVRNQKRH